MAYSRGTRVRKALTAGLCAAAMVCCAISARAQGGGQVTIPQWMQDSAFVENRYLRIWQYFTGNNITKFDVWTNEGNPETNLDDIRFYIDPTQNPPQLVSPWGSRVLSAPHPPYSVANPDTEPYANLVTIRVDDPDSTSGFTDLEYPGDGTQVFSPAVITLPRGLGFFAPYRFEDGTIEVTQKVEFARDIVRIEWIVRNLGGTARRVGVRALIDPYVNYWGPTRSMFLPGSRERVFFEADYGQRTGTPTTPRNPAVPPVWELYDDDEGPNPIFIAKGYLTGLGATPPTRVVLANSLNLFPAAGTWDYSVDDPMELRISDPSVLLYWDPVLIAGGQVRSFVTYAGVGVADHVVSNAYLIGQARSARTKDYATQGYVAALQTPFALPLRFGNADIGPTGSELVASFKAYLQNMYTDSSLPGASAFIDLPDGLQFAGGGGSRLISLGTLASVHSGGRDEGSAEWRVVPNGIEAGLLNVGVTFSNAFQDSTRVTRQINVPQGRRYQLGDDWRMVTFPFTYTQDSDDPAEVLGLQPGTFQIVAYNPLTGTYDPVSRLQPGRGYWVRMRGQGDTFVRAAGAAPVKLALDEKFILPLRRGWNQVGNPSPYSVPLRTLRVLVTGGDRIGFEEAVSRGLIRAGIYSYNRKTRQYVQLTRNSAVDPGKGIWIYSTRDQSILWPAPEGPQLSITP
jgi:hypothetical protein